MYIHTTVTTRVIFIPGDQRAAQAASLGTPVSTALNDPSFVEVAPLGLFLQEIGTTSNREQIITTSDGGQVIQGNGATSGAATVFASFSSLILLIIVRNFVFMILL